MQKSKWPEHEIVDLKHRTFVENQNHCPLCNSELSIRVETYLENDTLREEASCPKCDLLTRVRNHKMH